MMWLMKKITFIQNTIQRIENKICRILRHRPKNCKDIRDNLL